MGKRGYRGIAAALAALALAPVVPSGEWARLVGENIRRQRHQFPDRIRPDLPAELVR